VATIDWTVLMATHPYLHVDGTCAEALTFCAEILGGTDLQRMRDRDGPDLSDAMRSDRIIHGQIAIGDGRLMASDTPEGKGGTPQTSVSGMQSAPEVATAQTWFAALAASGAVAVRFGPPSSPPPSACARIASVPTG
jgi:PhnB protein